MSNQIQINYEEMRAVASEFDNNAGQIEEIINSLKSRTETLKGYWMGKAEDAFVPELESVNQRLALTPQMLREVATALRNTADTIQNAEQEAAGKMASTIVSDN